MTLGRFLFQSGLEMEAEIRKTLQLFCKTVLLSCRARAFTEKPKGAFMANQVGYFPSAVGLR